MLHDALSGRNDEVPEAENVRGWAAFHARNELDGSRILIHTYDRITSATITKATTFRDDGAGGCLLQNVRRATKLKGHDVRKPFEKARDQTFRLDPRACKIEELGDGTYYFETTNSGAERIYGFIFPRARYLLSFLLRAPVEA